MFLYLYFSGDIHHECGAFHLQRVMRTYFETLPTYFKTDVRHSSYTLDSHNLEWRDFFDFADECLVKTKDIALCSKCIFRYVETMSRAQEDRSFKPIKETDLSCYSCELSFTETYQWSSNDYSLGPKSKWWTSTNELPENKTTFWHRKCFRLIIGRGPWTKSAS